MSAHSIPISIYDDLDTEPGVGDENDSFDLR